MIVIAVVFSIKINHDREANALKALQAKKQQALIKSENDNRKKRLSAVKYFEELFYSRLENNPSKKQIELISDIFCRYNINNSTYSLSNKIKSLFTRLNRIGKIFVEVPERSFPNYYELAYRHGRIPVTKNKLPYECCSHVILDIKIKSSIIDSGQYGSYSGITKMVRRKHNMNLSLKVGKDRIWSKQLTNKDNELPVRIYVRGSGGVFSHSVFAINSLIDDANKLTIPPLRANWGSIPNCTSSGNIKEMHAYLLILDGFYEKGIKV